MNAADAMGRARLWSVRKILGLWVRVTLKPPDARARVTSDSRPVCFVLEHESHADLAVLDMVLGGADRSQFALMPRPRFFGRRKRAQAPRHLAQLVAAAALDPQFDVDLVPVAVFWGRAPHKEESLWRPLFVEEWVLVGRFRKLLNILVNGRDTLVYVGEPVRLRDGMQNGLDEARCVRRLFRALRTVLRAQRASTIGPDLSHRRTMVAQVLRAQAVRRAVRHEMQVRAADGRPLARRAALLLARKDALAIAANYSQVFITFMGLLLGRLWNWLYDGVEFAHAEMLNEVGDGAEVIYVPCHRSHMDYLLLSYVIYRQGFAVPHVAAGANLDMPIIGRFLRRGGAFFLRRSFKGDALYAAVFAQYLSFMMARGHPLEYFIEGGRSRTGRLLSPRTGMLSMTVRSHLRDPRRPVVFMPVYFGYERIAEGRTYIGELSGRPKEKESVPGLIKAVIAVLRSEFGTVHVNLGTPILLDEVLQRHAHGGSVDWITAAIGDLSTRIVTGINAAAAVTPIGLVATVVLATARQSMPENSLVDQLELYQRLLREAPYGPLVTVCALSGAAMVHYAEEFGLLERQAHPLGDLLRMNAENAVLATYYRNNILHLFAVPSLLACCFISNTHMRTADIQRLVGRVYPYIAAELFLRWDETEIGGVVAELLDRFVGFGLLATNDDRSEWHRTTAPSPQALRLSLLAQGTIQTIERYYLVIALLLQAGSGHIGPQALEQRCHLMAQRLSILHGMDSPEFFDRSLFRNFIELLIRRNVVQTSSNDALVFGELLLGVAADAQWVLSEQIRHSILQVTLGT